MWPFGGSSGLDAAVKNAWGGIPWIGVVGHFDRITRPGALRKWAKSVVDIAKRGHTPVMISVGRDDPVGQDRATGKTLWWANSMRLVCPAVPEGIETLQFAIQSFDRPLLELPTVSASEERFEGPGDAIAWCRIGKTWRCGFKAKPPAGLTATPARKPDDPVSTFENLPAVRGVRFSPDGGRVVFTFYDGRESGVFVGDASTGELLLAISPFPVAANDVAWSPDGRYLAAGFDYSRDDGSSVARIWDANGGQEAGRVVMDSGSVNAVEFSPDSKTLATGSSNGGIRLWDVPARTQRLLLEGHTGPIRRIAYGPDGTTLASGAEDNTIRVWDARDGRQLRVIEGHTTYVTGVALGPDNLLASSSYDKSVRLWRTDTGEERYRWESDPTGFSVALSPDGTRLAYGTNTYWSGGKPALHLFDVATGQRIGSPRGTELPCNGIAFSPDGQHVAAAFGDTGNNNKGAVRVWNVEAIGKA